MNFVALTQSTPWREGAPTRPIKVNLDHVQAIYRDDPDEFTTLVFAGLGSGGSQAIDVVETLDQVIPPVTPTRAVDERSGADG